MLPKEAEWKVKETQNDVQEWGVDSRPTTPLEEGWGAPMDDEHRAEWSTSDSKVSVSYPSINCSWPSVEGGVEVAIEVRSNVVESESGCSACRSLMLIDCLSVPDILSSLCHSAIGTSTGSCTLSGSRRGTE
jgi:hypothetical protein